MAQKTLAKKAHTYDAGKITTKATYDKEGVKTYTCKVCKATKTEKIAKLKKTTLNSKWAAISKTSVTYTGKAIKPTVTVKNGKTTLKNGTDYTVSYKNNTSVGKATVTITGKGKYGGTISKTFSIVPTAMKPNSVKNASNGMKITWKKQAGVDNYVVYRKDSKGKVTTLKTVSGSTTSYTDTTAKSGQKYRYTVRAKEGKNLYGYTWTNAYLRLSNVKVSTASNAVAGVTVKWNRVTGATGYSVYRTDSKGKKTKIYTAKSGRTVSYVDKKAKSGQKYTYTVVAYNGKTTSTSTGKAVTRLAAPKITKATNSKKSTVTLQWSKVTGAKKYVVYRKTGNGAYKKLYTTKNATTVKFTDKTAKKGRTYTYAVKAVNGSTLSSYQAKAVRATK